MNFTNLNIKLIEDSGYCDVLIRVEGAFADEFGEEFVLYSKNDRQADNLRDHIRSSFPRKNLRNARIILHGITLAAVPILTKAERLEQNTRHMGLVSTYRPDPEPEDTKSFQCDYEVRPGDTLWIIASKFNTTTETLTKMNNLTGSPKTGQKISVPLNTALETV